ncbi:MAG TPA: hypothetical protein VKT73_03455 [Xanthobacteraceae bacterium]|nr:hypothetical protein [Xanthobacteraceae bacterium]
MIAMLIVTLSWFGSLLLVYVSDDRGLVIGWIGTFFFPLFGIHILIACLPGRSQLTLDKDGMTIVNGLFRRRDLWPDVSRISATKIQTGSTSAGFVSFNNRAVNGTFSGIFNSTLSRGNSFITDMYDLDPDEMARLLKLWRDRALRHRL